MLTKNTLSLLQKYLHRLFAIALANKINAERTATVILAVGTRGRAVVSPTSHQDQVAIR